MVKRVILAFGAAAAAIMLIVFGRLHILPGIPWNLFDSFAAACMSVMILTMASAFVASDDRPKP